MRVGIVRELPDDPLEDLDARVLLLLLRDESQMAEPLGRAGVRRDAALEQLASLRQPLQLERDVAEEQLRCRGGMVGLELEDRRSASLRPRAGRRLLEPCEAEQEERGHAGLWALSCCASSRAVRASSLRPDSKARKAYR